MFLWGDFWIFKSLVEHPKFGNGWELVWHWMENSSDLFDAARAGDSGALSELLSHGANVNMKNQVLSQFGSFSLACANSKAH